jgi:hypothetical protein
MLDGQTNGQGSSEVLVIGCLKLDVETQASRVLVAENAHGVVERVVGVMPAMNPSGR